MNRRTIAVWVALIFVGVLAWTVLQDQGPDARETSETFATDVHEGIVELVVIQDDGLDVYLSDGDSYSVDGLTDQRWVDFAQASGVAVEEGDDPLLDIAIIAVPVLLIILALVWFGRRTMSARGMGTFTEMRKSRARLLGETVHARFDDVAGADEAKLRLNDVVAWLGDPTRWRASGVRMPRGVLMEGPPGCGKTLLARAVAGEAGVPFFYVSGSEFVEMLVGVGAARVRDMFEEAKKKAPAVIFIDEIDAIGRRRGSGVGPSHEEREQTLNQLLVALDGVEGRGGDIVVLAATNRADILDPALLRPGRFDLHLRIPALSEEAREVALRIHLKGRTLDLGVDLAALARQTAGLSGAELENLANEATLKAARRVLQEGGDASTVRVMPADFSECLAERAARQPGFDRLDAAMVASASQLVRPDLPIPVQLTLVGGSEVTGRLLWVDAQFVKVAPQADGESGPALVIPKMQVLSIAADGVLEAADPGTSTDPWAHQTPELA